ncbi:hypothetical protein ORJ04_09475 [Rheinheimera baltica]|uniref:Transmembrane protein n=1 Tax=Rheinheimera baltica TaxID=67576 RepID=A0ABT9HYG3_9GAMM|nr:hypothetical protein [Rheinheimera baltica]MDP5136178.1 hypothetical protein [Rheinheimera baltica]
MLIFYQRWSRRLYRLRPLFILLCVGAAAVFVWLLFSGTPQQGQQWQLSAVVTALTALILWVWATLFHTDLPVSAPGQGFATRIKIRLHLMMLYILALLVSVLLLATTYLGLRVLKGIIANLFFS